jgi:hypothetical protein
MQRALGCFTGTIWRTGEGVKPGTQVLLTVPEPVIELRRRDQAPFYLRATQTFHYDDDERYPGERKVFTDGYAYTLSERPDLQEELLAWHWHPDAGIPDPHLHIGKGHSVHGELGRLHIPCGRIALEEVLLFTIDELATEPLCGVEEARHILNETLDAFRRFRRWH